MALLPILAYPDLRLRQKALPVARVDDDLRCLAANMAETMYAAPGIGLAAVQVNVPLRVITMDLSESKSELLVLINPEIVERSGEQECEEGCLSVPGEYAKVRRAARIVFTAMNLEGKTTRREAEGLLAVCVQHEIDHLDGKVFVDHLSRLKQERIRERLKKKQGRRGDVATAGHAAAL
jgi:peptide deformylase